MQKPIRSVADLGLVLRATRKSLGVRLDDLAGSSRVGHVFAREVEHGKETVQMGRVLRLLEELGVKLSVEVPKDALSTLQKLEKTGLKPLKSRSRPSTTVNPATTTAPQSKDARADTKLPSSQKGES